MYFFFSDRKHEESIKTYSIRIIRDYLKEVKCHEDHLLGNGLILNVHVYGFCNITSEIFFEYFVYCKKLPFIPPAGVCNILIKVQLQFNKCQNLSMTM